MARPPAQGISQERVSPLPLRSAEEPRGITTRALSDLERLKLDKANKVYDNAFEIIRVCLVLKVPWLVENPSNSYLWYLSSFADLLERDGVGDAIYDACEFGGDRPKRQRLRGTHRALLDHFDAKLCTNTHVHKPWKVDGLPQTSIEATYPPPLLRASGPLAFDDDPREEEDERLQPGDGSGKETRRQPEAAT